ncbi:helix-turn-helix domain-containing protein [Ferrimonas pelagia]|uniref:Helix-turn-helix domain-containing protein n=1 Tax=Ferrimonas pelagia TaxID=1177826 RepID=A0ABP9FJT2_9GAMM
MQWQAMSFIRERRQLVDLERERTWELPRAEFLVLTQLIDHPNIVLSKHRLRCAGEVEPVMSSSAVVKAVFTLRRFMGADETGPIVTVAGKGYVWRLPNTQPTKARPQRLKRVGAALGVLLGSGVLLGLLLLDPLSSSPSALLHPSVTPLSGGRQLHLVQVRPNERDTALLQRIELAMTQAFESCSELPWHTVYLARSVDGQVLNLTLAGTHQNLPVLRNVKISDQRLEPEFEVKHWWQEVPLCEP